MSSHDITIAGYVVIAAVALMLDFRARRAGTDLRTFDDVVRWALQTHSGRIGIVSAWAWLGLHFLG